MTEGSVRHVGDKRAMPLRMTRRFRFRAALTLAVVYAFCILAPHAALAFTGATSAAPCLTEAQGLAHVHHVAANTHVHADGTAHEHGDKNRHSDGKAQHGNCCGMFCVTALATDPGVVLVVPELGTPSLVALETGLPSRGPERINRPPIV